MQIWSKKLPTKQSQIKTNQKSQIPKIYSYLFSIALLLPTSLSLSLYSCSPPLSLSQLDDDSLQKYWLKLESFLKHDVYYDIDGLDLLSELKVLKETLQIKEYTPIDILNYIKMLDSFPNTCIAYRILLIIPVIVSFTERSFSKLKLIKSYLKSTMFQERLSGLAILLIENKMLEDRKSVV